MDATDTAVDAAALTPTGFTGPEREATWKGVRGLVVESVFPLLVPDFRVDLRPAGALTIHGVRDGDLTPPPAWPGLLHTTFDGSTLADVLDITQALLSAAGVPAICEFEATSNDRLGGVPVINVMCGPVRDAATIPVCDSYDFLDGLRVSWQGQLSGRVGPLSAHYPAGIGDSHGALVTRSLEAGIWEATTTAGACVGLHEKRSGFATLADVLTWAGDVYKHAGGHADMLCGFAVGQHGTDEPALTIVAW